MSMALLYNLTRNVAEATKEMGPAPAISDSGEWLNRCDALLLKKDASPLEIESAYRLQRFMQARIKK